MLPGSGKVKDEFDDRSLLFVGVSSEFLTRRLEGTFDSLDLMETCPRRKLLEESVRRMDFVEDVRVDGGSKQCGTGDGWRGRVWSV